MRREKAHRPAGSSPEAGRVWSKPGRVQDPPHPAHAQVFRRPKMKYRIEPRNGSRMITTIHTIFLGLSLLAQSMIATIYRTNHRMERK